MRPAPARRTDTVGAVYDRVSPWTSLAFGVLATSLLPYGMSYAPVAATLVLLAWALAAVLARWLPEPEEGPPESRGHYLLRRFTIYAAANLFQNVLFFLVPVWFRSATWSSVNAVFPLLLAGLAVFSCFDVAYRRWVLDRPLTRALVSALVFFAALVPALTVFFTASPRVYTALAGALATLVAVGSLVILQRPWRTRSVAALLAACAASVIGLTGASPWLPPVPVDGRQAGAGTAIQQRELVGAAERFEAGVEKVVARFAVAAPPGYEQPIRFVWSHDGEPVGEPLPARIRGGREGGFRTWTRHKAPGPGAWRVDLETDAGQLIGRVDFTVGPEPAPLERVALPGLATVLLLVLASFLAGLIDAVAGGGGLILLPALLVGLPASTPVPWILGTNKVAAVTGTTFATLRYLRQGLVRARDLAGPVAAAMLGSAAGAALATRLDSAWMRPLMVALLSLALAVTWLRPELGAAHRPRFTALVAGLVATLVSLLVGAYDGFFGPGTGMLLLFAGVTLLGHDFLRASAFAKAVNWGSNIAAVVLFVSQGAWYPWLALALALGNGLGGRLGAGLAIDKGNRAIRGLFVAVAVVLILRLAWPLVERLLRGA